MVAGGELTATDEHAVEAGHLHDAEGGGDVAHAVVERRFDEFARGALAVVSQRSETICEAAIVREAHAALAGGEDLSGVEAQT